MAAETETPPVRLLLWPSHFAMYVAGRIGWPTGFLFSGDAPDE